MTAWRQGDALPPMEIVVDFPAGAVKVEMMSRDKMMPWSMWKAGYELTLSQGFEYRFIPNSDTTGVLEMRWRKRSIRRLDEPDVEWVTERYDIVREPEVGFVFADSTRWKPHVPMGGIIQPIKAGLYIAGVLTGQRVLPDGCAGAKSERAKAF